MLLALAGGLGAEAAGVRVSSSAMPPKTVEEVLVDHADRLLSIPGVVGVGEGLCQGRPCIKVYVRKKTPALAEEIPAIIDGFPVDVEETGEFRALPEKKG